MYYLELIQRFWNFNRKANSGSAAIAMYLYLLKTGKERDAYDFKVSDVVLSKDLGLTRKTVKSTKEKLRNLGLIQYQTKNGLPGSYRLLLNYPLEIPEHEKIDKAKAEIRNVSKEIAENVNPRQNELPFHQPPEVFDPQSGTSSPQPTNENNPVIPDFEQFIEFAQTLEAYEPRLDFHIKQKYESWVCNSWKNGAERPITNWRSSLKSILPFLKNTMSDHLPSVQNIPNIKRPESKFGKQ